MDLCAKLIYRLGGFEINSLLQLKEEKKGNISATCYKLQVKQYKYALNGSEYVSKQILRNWS